MLLLHFKCNVLVWRLQKKKEINKTFPTIIIKNYKCSLIMTKTEYSDPVHPRVSSSAVPICDLKVPCCCMCLKFQYSCSLGS